MAKDKKLHLWIPEEEISEHPRDPQARSRDYGLSHAEHGQKLSKGLEEVVSFLARVQKSSAVSDDDLMTFKVILQEKEDFADQQKFIEKEGMKITAVKDARHAVVTTHKDVFDNLRNRVNRYRDKGIKKDFQYIEGFEPFTAEDKKTLSMIKTFQQHPELLTVDVQIMLLPDLEESKQDEYTKKIVERLIAEKGKIEGEPYRLTDGTPIIRTIVSPSSLNDVLDDPVIYRVEETNFFHSAAPSAVNPFDKILQLEPGIDIDALTPVVVLDNGVNMPDGLKAVVPIHWTPKKERTWKRIPNFGDHGTAVASKVAFGNDLGVQLRHGKFVPRAKIIDAAVMDGGVPTDVLIKRIKEAVEEFAPVAKIYNLSVNVEKYTIPGDRMSFLGCELDMLSNKYGVRFVISAGNHYLYRSENDLRSITGDDDARISEPADAMLGITVGAVVGVDHNGSLSRRNEIAPYSRKGPGFQGYYKPDLVAYGSTVLKDDTVPKDEYSLMIHPGGLYPDAGTSFTAPVVAGDLAQLLSIVPNEDIGLAEALLFNGAVRMYDIDGANQETVDFATSLYGRGLSSPENSMFSSENRVSFVHSGTLNRRTKKHVKFHVPQPLASAKIGKGIDKARVTVTCLTQPPVDQTKGTEYSAAYVSASLHRLNSNGNLVTDNPSVSENRTKWNTCYHFSNNFSAFSSGSWEVWLELITRWGIKDDEEIPYSIVITIEDLTASDNMYSEIVKETAGRYTPVQPVRVTVR